MADEVELAPLKVSPWDLDKPFDLGRAYSGSDLPVLDGLLAPLQATADRATPPLVATSPALLEDYSRDHQAQPYFVHAEECAPPFCGSLQPLESCKLPTPSPQPYDFPSAVSLKSEDTPRRSQQLQAGMHNGNFSSLSSADCVTIRANLQAIRDPCFGGDFKSEREPLDMSTDDDDDDKGEEDDLGKMHNSEEALRADHSDSDYRPSPRRSSRSRRAATHRTALRRSSHAKGKDKKKVGRPITYKGDPEASNLTEEERRRIKRRIANRESARRVRQKRHDLMGELQMNIGSMQRQNAKLLEHCGRMEKQKAVVMGQVAEMQENWAHAASESTRLHSEIATLRQTLEVNMRFMEKTGFAFKGPVDAPQQTVPLPRYASDMPAPLVLQGNRVMGHPSPEPSPFKTPFQDFLSSVPLWT